MTIEDNSAASLLGRIRAERGYTLSYHEVYARLDPDFLEAYAGLYRACTLTPRALTPRQRELVWVSLLAAIHEDVGSIHLERAAVAGVAPRELAAAVQLAGVADSWTAISFACERWEGHIESDLRTLYGGLLDVVARDLGPDVLDLAALAVHGARRATAPFEFHLQRLYEASVPEALISEAVSYLLQPVGANTLLWATDTWFDALSAGRLPVSPILGRAEMPTRRS